MSPSTPSTSSPSSSHGFVRYMIESYGNVNNMI